MTRKMILLSSIVVKVVVIMLAVITIQQQQQQQQPAISVSSFTLMTIPTTNLSSRSTSRKRRRVSRPTMLSSPSYSYSYSTFSRLSTKDLSSPPPILLQASEGDNGDCDDTEDGDDGDDSDDDSQARSQFGTKMYWDEMYQGRGDFPSDEYQWYYGWDEIKSVVEQYYTPTRNRDSNILVLGIGNDPVLLDLLQAGHTKLTATDYSKHAIERQQDLLDFGGYGDYVVVDCSNAANDDNENYDDDDDDEKKEKDDMKKRNNGGTDDDDDDETQSTSMTFIELRHMDARKMDPNWTEKFDLILEKGCLDAIYLSGDGNLERVERELFRILRQHNSSSPPPPPSSSSTSSEKIGGILVSVSGVVPDDVRRTVFDETRWTWLRDGTDDLKAGKFVLAPKKTKKKTEKTS